MCQAAAEKKTGALPPRGAASSEGIDVELGDGEVPSTLAVELFYSETRTCSFSLLPLCQAAGEKKDGEKGLPPRGAASAEGIDVELGDGEVPCEPWEAVPPR